MMSSEKPSNPKDAIGSDKLPLHLWPPTATAMGCVAMANGALKYGRGNFRAIGVKASIYVDAAMRHLTNWFEGEEVDPDDGVPHLAAALACIAIIIDAEAAGLLTDDRAYPGGYRELLTKLTPHVKRLKELHKEKNPKHYTKPKNDPLTTDGSGQAYPQTIPAPLAKQFKSCSSVIDETGQAISMAIETRETGCDTLYHYDTKTETYTPINIC